jgi:hypothetical protein
VRRRPARGAQACSTKVFDMQLKQGDDAVLKSLRSVLKEDRWLRAS